MDEPLAEGVIVTHRDDGSRLAETTYERGVANGPYRDYWSNGVLACEGQYVNGIQEGEWRFYKPDGSPLEVIRFAAGREVVDWDRFFGQPATGSSS